MAELPQGVTQEMLLRYNVPGPRYTSYPTAVEFHEGFGPAEYGEHLARADAAGPEAPLSLYVHLPFCEERCLFCGCNVIIAKKHTLATAYLETLERELAMLAERLPHRRQLAQLHWGGGTPTYLSTDEMERLMGSIRSHFEILPDAEVAIEVDPRVTTVGQMQVLKAQGFNRVSLGVQDFDPKVQAAVHRIQSFEMTRDLITLARDLGFPGLNVDLIYGLPFQSREGFEHTITKILEVRPDRLAVYSYAHVPWMHSQQKWVVGEALPTAEEKLALFGVAFNRLVEGGYRSIGMDHFALPHDELTLAMDRGTLHRNFMGYTTKPAADQVAIGVSAIGDVQEAYAQNEKKLSRWNASIAAGEMPVSRGIRLTRDDSMRRELIRRLMCDFALDTAAFERRWDVAFDREFATELRDLADFETQGLVERANGSIRLTPLGRIFVRNVSMVFDRHLREKSRDGRPTFSRTV